MTINFEQLFQQALAEHLNNNLDEAERLYKKTLEIEPKHPDANHNMGSLALGAGKVEAALPFLKTALEVNPKIAHYWITYICL